MVRHGLGILLLLAQASPALAQSAAPAPTVTTASHQARITALVAKAEREQRAGRLPEAVFAYVEAFDLERDPRIGGRLGVLLVQLDNPVAAADLLMNALERATDAAPTERLEFFKAYEVARSRVCRIEVTVSEAHTKILVDGRVTQQDGANEFAMFLQPGKHELRAKLDGYQDAAADISAWAGGTLKVDLALVSAHSSAPVSISVVSPQLPAPGAPVWLPSTNIATEPGYSPKEDPFYEEPKPLKAEAKRGSRFSVTGGIVTVLGVASWSPAVGGVIGVGLRPHEYVSFGLEGRAAWLTTGVADRKISAMTAAGLLSGCGHLGWFFGCGLVHVGALSVTPDTISYKDSAITQFKLGGGARLGARFKLGSAFVLQGAVDALALHRGTQIVIGRMVVAEQPPVMLGAEISGGMEF